MSFITHKISPDMNGALVLASSIGSVYIGLVEMEKDEESGEEAMVFLGERTIALYNPLRYKEMAGPGATEGAMGIQIGMMPIYHGVGSMHNYIVVFDSLYSLHQEKGEDQKLSTSYFDSINQQLAQRSGLIAPTAEDLRKISGPQPQPR